MTHTEAEVIYKTIFLPTITYPFPATFVPTTALENAQSTITPLILSKMGYNRNMPKAVMYNPTSHGGLGIRHLPSEQGLQKILHAIKHLHTKTSLGNLLTVSLQAYQIQAGLAECILVNTHPLPWTPNWWITNLRSALHEIQGQIRIHHLWMIPPSWINDRHLMDDFLDAGHTPKELQTINSCHLHLQVTTLAEITNHTGTHLLPDIMSSTSNKSPTLTTISVSKYSWPTQPSPTKAAWKIWTKALQKQYTKPGLSSTLKIPLGSWLPQASQV